MGKCKMVRYERLGDCEVRRGGRTRTNGKRIKTESED